MPGPVDTPKYKDFFEARQKLDYFILGGIGAFLAFSLQYFDPSRAPRGAFLAPVSWLLLLVALGSGLWHMDCAIHIVRNMTVAVEASENRIELQKAIWDAADKAFLRDGTVLEGAHAIRRAHHEATTQIGEMMSTANRLDARATFLYQTQNVSLVLGFAATSLWRTLNIF
jgi:hypothetical protein